MLSTAAKKLPLVFVLFSRTTTPDLRSVGIGFLVRVWLHVPAQLLGIVSHIRRFGQVLISNRNRHPSYFQTHADYFLQTPSTVTYCITLRK